MYLIMNVGTKIVNNFPTFYSIWTCKLLFNKKISLPHHQTHHCVVDIKIQNDMANMSTSINLSIYLSNVPFDVN